MRCLLSLFLKAIEQDYYFPLVEYEEHSEDVAPVLCPQLIQAVFYQFDEFLRQSVLCF